MPASTKSSDDDLDFDSVDLGSTRFSLAKPSPAHLDHQTYELKLQPPSPITPTSDKRVSRISQRPRSMFIELPPVDRGRGAWGYLVGAFLVEAFVWGFPLSFGVFQNYLTTHTFPGNPVVPVIGTLCSGLAYLGTPFSMRIISRYPKFRTPMMWLGLAMCVLSCLAASFVNKIWMLIFTQGIVYGIGASFLYVPTLSYMNEWFVQRRGLAYGIMFGGTGISGMVLPIMFEKLLAHSGFAMTLRIWAFLMVALTAPAIWFLVRGRLPVSQVSVARRTDFSFFKEPFFLFVAASNLLQGVGFFIPGIYLPSYATDLLLPSLQSTLVLSLLNVASVFGQIALGYMADRWGSTQPLFWSTLIGSASVCLLWGFSKSFATLLAFSIIFGLSAGGYSVLLSRFALEISMDDPNRQLAMYGVFAFERGVGNIIAGPISAALLGSTKTIGAYAIDKYANNVWFTSAALLAGALSAFGSCVIARPAKPR